MTSGFLTVVGNGALLAMALTGTANANNLTADLSNYPGAHPQLQKGLTGQVRISVPINGKRDLRASDSVRLDFEAGPQLLLSRQNGETRRSLAPTVRLSYKMDEYVQMSFAGSELYSASLRPLSYSDRQALAKDGPKAGISKGVLIGLGVAAAAGLGFYLVATGAFSGPTD